MAAAQSFSKTLSSTRPDYKTTRTFSSNLTQSTTIHLKTPWLGASKLSIHSTILIPQLSNYLPITATAISSLPTAKPDRVSFTEKVPKWSSKGIKSFTMGELEARKLKYGTYGTEAVIMGILIEGTNQASKVLRANGITLLKVREETTKLLGKADMYYFSPEHPPLTEAAQRVLDWAIDEKLKSGEDGEITALHLLLGVWSEGESPGHKILATLGFNSETAHQLHSLISKPGFVEV